MPEHVSIYQLLGMTFLVLVTIAWGAGLVFMLRRGRAEGVMWPSARPLPALPHQRVGPQRESVELTPAEEDAFAGLVRRLSADR
ncbi:hypothetical protein [Streptomyces sp. AC555_RSS877]|uniref:hypothetical protein n=1 Tax=Streptomyces sp. AC555_RSS877 TaxID=2823688 RepID=UPI001C26F617|nr:hypothetical protein [Streptomyces sp. AC555_RSS877]